MLQTLREVLSTNSNAFFGITDASAQTMTSLMT